MEVFQVGGCVRDKILGCTITDYDYVVVGSNTERMIALGYKQVGKDFPVFLHPETQEEYALARTERKTLSGHRGFACDTEEVTLEQDLLRRDLTINAIALDCEGLLIDPYGGCRDIAERILRPVSEAFLEDPLRVLRVARLRAQLGGDWKLDLKLFEYTKECLLELEELPKERVYQEFKKAMSAPRPSVYFQTLKELGALCFIYPELYAMTQCEHDNPYHMEGSVFTHTMMVLDRCKYSESRVAALFHDVGKVPCKDVLGTFHGHVDKYWVTPAFECIRNTYGFSSSELEIAEYVALNHHKWQNIIDGHTGSKKILKLLLGVREAKKVIRILDAVYADIDGRIGVKKVYKYTKEEIGMFWVALNIHRTDCRGLTVEQIKQKVHREKLNLLRGLL